MVIFDSIPGKGKPLQLEDFSMVPPELRMSYKILKNAGMIPLEMELQKDILKIEDLIACCYDEAEKKITRRVNGKNAALSAGNGKEKG